jgi:hypothetical protein
MRCETCHCERSEAIQAFITKRPVQKPGVFWILRAHKNKRSALNACEITKNMIYFFMDTLSVVLQPPYKEEPHLQVKHNEQEK